MTTHTVSSAMRGAEGTAIGPAVVRYARTALSTLRMWNTRRVLARELALMDAHMLADIGLTRSDVTSAFSEPLWRDPSVRLASMAGDRHKADLQRRGSGSNRPVPLTNGRGPLTRRPDIEPRGKLAA